MLECVILLSSWLSAVNARALLHGHAAPGQIRRPVTSGAQMPSCRWYRLTTAGGDCHQECSLVHAYLGRTGHVFHANHVVCGQIWTIFQTGESIQVFFPNRVMHKASKIKRPPIRNFNSHIHWSTCILTFLVSAQKRPTRGSVYCLPGHLLLLHNSKLVVWPFYIISSLKYQHL